MYAMRANRIEPGEPEGYFDIQFQSQALQVLPGEYLVTANDVMLVTVLGSCVSACVRDPVAGVGGMNHFMLPESDLGGAVSESARYGSYAMEMLINEMLKRGARRSRLEVKLFGGAAILPGFTVSNVGDRNVRFARAYAAAEGLRIAGEDLLDVVARRVHYFPRTGRVMLKRLPSVQQVEMVAHERRYLSRLQQSPTQGSVELF